MSGRVNWSYVAGFFDGEGCVSANGTRSPHYQVVFAQNDTASLLAIREFLAEHGVHSKFYGPYGGRCHRLSIDGNNDVLAFCDYMLPYVIVKKRVLEDARRLLLIFPLLPHYTALRKCAA